MCQWICSFILWVVFIFCWWFPFLSKYFLFNEVPFVYFFLLFPLPGEIYQIKKCYEQCPRFCCLCFPLWFLWFWVWHLSLFVFILVFGVRSWSSFIFLHASVFISQRHLLNKLFVAHCTCLLPQMLIDYKVVGLFLGSICIYFLKYLPSISFS